MSQSDYKEKFGMRMFLVALGIVYHLQNIAEKAYMITE